MATLASFAVAQANSVAPDAAILAGARRQARERAFYTMGYVALNYPGGDLPRHQGVCTDVVIRALRTAGFDLQKLIHEDMKPHFDLYPQNWGLRRPDSNIDHRRVPNQVRFFERHGLRETTSLAPTERSRWRAGDVVYWKLSNGLDHAGVITDRRGASGHPMVIHNLGRTAEEDVLDAWHIAHHFRFPPPPSAALEPEVQP